MPYQHDTSPALTIPTPPHPGYSFGGVQDPQQLDFSPPFPAPTIQASTMPATSMPAPCMPAPTLPPPAATGRHSLHLPPVPHSPTRQKLRPVDVVIQQHRNYQNPAGIGRLAIALARECVFGEDVMAASVSGGPKLSGDGVAFIRQTLRHLFPKADEEVFKSYWSSARHAIGRACTRAGKKTT